MKRKVIQIANSTLLVSMPKPWADKHNVKKGDEVHIETNGPTMTVSTDSKPVVEKTELNLDDYGLMSKRAIHALYKRGIDEVEISFENPESFNILQDSIRNETVGYEIVEQGAKSCTIKNVTGYPESFETLLRRIFMLLVTMANESMGAIRNRDFDSVKNLEHLEGSNNRFTTLCRSYINKVGKVDYDHIGPLYYIIEDLENIADEYKYMFQYFQEHGEDAELSDEFFDIYKETNGLVRNVYSMFYDFNPDLVSKAAKQRKELISKCKDLMQESENKQEVMMTHHLLVIVQKMFNLVGPMLVIAL